MTYQLLWIQYQDSWWWGATLSETYRVVCKNTVEKECIFLASIIRIYHDARYSECQRRLLHLGHVSSVWRNSCTLIWTFQNLSFITLCLVKHASLLELVLS